MLRRVLERQGAAAEAALSDSATTPLRSHWSGLNPTRLIDKHMRSVYFTDTRDTITWGIIFKMELYAMEYENIVWHKRYLYKVRVDVIFETVLRIVNWKNNIRMEIKRKMNEKQSENVKEIATDNFITKNINSRL
ncbi:hypothetical protein PV327_001643 [Microctonus hyperodae]|uniref:Uncharacterized protein n=1 Tax=Microctonus hyperodae TaxID=165561 RepID=A0AA39FE96_MICHY|nr:hypothetical protein PV327_001643 [Microctonus hyperodae]